MSAGMGGYSSIGGAVKKMMAEEGIRGFYKGLYPNLLKVSTLSLLTPGYVPRFCFCCSMLVIE